MKFTHTSDILFLLVIFSSTCFSQATLSREYIRLGGRTIAVENAAGSGPASIAFGMVSPSNPLPAMGGPGSVVISATPGVNWSVSAFDNWIQLSSGSGTGSQTLSFLYSTNSGSGRVTTLILSSAGLPSQYVQIEQQPSSSYSVPGNGTYDDTDSRITYSTGWSTNSDATFYGGTQHYAPASGSVVGASASFTFSGTQINYVYPAYINFGGAQIFIDNPATPVATLSEYDLCETTQHVWKSQTLSPGVHTIMVVATGTGAVGSSPGYIAVDAFIVGSSWTPPPPPRRKARAGVYTPSSNAAALDCYIDLHWDGSPSDFSALVIPAGATLVMGDWDGSGRTKLGYFLNGYWALDSNGDGVINSLDKTGYFGQPGDVPVVGDWTGNGTAKVGIFRQGYWALDSNGNIAWDAGVDASGTIGTAGDTPIVGDWNGDGRIKVGIYRPSQAMFGLDYNGNLVWDPSIDKSGNYGIVGDMPLVGDWSGNGQTKIGIYRSSAAYFALDYNGDLSWDSPDRSGSFGAVGDNPVIGDWDGTGVDRVGIFRQGLWTEDLSLTGPISWVPSDPTGYFGNPGDTPIVGRW